MKKKWLLLKVVLLMFGLIAVACEAERDDKKSIPIQIFLDGKPISFEVEPVQINDKVYAEYASLFTALGFQPEYNSTTKTIKALSPTRIIEISEDGMNASVDGYSVYTEEDVKKIDGKIMISVSFAVSNSGKKINWDDKKNLVMITGPTPEQEAAYLNVLKEYSTIEATKDIKAYRDLFTKDTVMKVNELLQQWNKTETKTTFLGTFIDWYSDTEVILLVKNHVIKISGGFYPENYSTIRYTLHPENGEWKIYEIEILKEQFVYLEKLFDQAIDVPSEVKSEIEAALTAQTKALNSDDIDAYSSLNFFDDDNVEQSYLSLLPLIMDDNSNTTIEEWAVVDYVAPDQATILISLIQDEDIMQGKVRKLYSQGMQKVDGKWRFLLNRSVYSAELVK
jgi:hypothetical protein